MEWPLGDDAGGVESGHVTLILTGELAELHPMSSISAPISLLTQAYPEAEAMTAVAILSGHLLLGNWQCWLLLMHD